MAVRTAPVDGVRSTLRNFRLGGLAERAKATPVLRTYYGDTKYQLGNINHMNGLVQDCSNAIANALESLQSCTKPSISAHKGLIR